MSVIEYSDKYSDAEHDYRHVYLPEKWKFRPFVFLKEAEWRALGIQMSRGWMHYAVHKPEPHVLLFKRPQRFDEWSAEEQEAHVRRSDAMVEEMNRELNERYLAAKERKSVLESNYLL